MKRPPAITAALPSFFFHLQPKPHAATATATVILRPRRSDASSIPPYPPVFSTIAQTILVGARDPSETATRIAAAVDEGRLEDAWAIHEQSLVADGLPRKSVVAKLLVALAETFDPLWLAHAHQLLESVLARGKKELLEREHLLYLALVLARSSLPVPASAVLRRLAEMEQYPDVVVWAVVVGYMARTPAGALLAAELVGEFGHVFKDHRVDPRKKSNRPLLSMKPNAAAFGMAVAGCLVFGLSKKAEKLLELMSQVGVKADAGLLILTACVYERNGRLDELNKLRRHVIDNADVGTSQLQQFYEYLLSCHLKLNDLESASGIVLEMIRKAKEAKSSLVATRSILGAVGGCPGNILPDSPGQSSFRWITGDPLSFQGFCKNKSINVPRLAGETRELLHDLHCKLQEQVELVRSECGILHPTDKVYARLIGAFLEAGKITELATFLIKVSKEEGPTSNENSLAVLAITACISLQHLDQAHDLLDEMRFSGLGVGSTVYSDLLKAYCAENRVEEIKALLKDAWKAGVQLDSSCYEVLIQSRAHRDVGGALELYKEMNDSGISRSNSGCFEKKIEGCVGDVEAGVTTRLLEEIKDVKKADCAVHEWNSVIHFFCRKGLMDDAQKALKKMKALGHSPNSCTFHSLVTAYVARGGKFVEVAELWGEMKVLARTSLLEFDQELLDSLLHCFVRGGLFLRANEVVIIMEKAGMFIDKYKYRSLWYKYHDILYRVKAPKIQTEAQLERREAALLFKRWIDLT